MGQARVLTEREIRRVLLWCAANKHAARNKALILITHLSGMRVGEVAALRIVDVVDRDGAVRSEVALSAEQTKGRHGRVVLLPKRLQVVLAEYLATRFTAAELTALRGTERENWALFPTQKHPKRGFTANTLAQLFGHIYKESGIEGASSHSGRRTFITALADRGVGVRVLMELAGHRSPAVTMRYIDASPAVKRSAVELI